MSLKMKIALIQIAWKIYQGIVMGIVIWLLMVEYPWTRADGAPEGWDYAVLCIAVTAAGLASWGALWVWDFLFFKPLRNRSLHSHAQQEIGDPVLADERRDRPGRGPGLDHIE